MEATHTLNSAFHLLIRYSLIFVVRHWLISAENCFFTVVIGVGLVRLYWRIMPGLFSPRLFLRVQRYIFLCALIKCAFFMVMGESRQRGSTGALCSGVQFPDPSDLFNVLGPHRSISIWLPTPATQIVTVLLLIIASLMLGRRLYEVQCAIHSIRALQRVQESDVIGSLRDSLRRAAHDINRPGLAGTPIVLINNLPGPSPFVLGLIRPIVVVGADSLLGLATRDQLDAALRHELMHIVRRDNLWRWLQLWLEDIARCTIIGAWVSRAAFEIEEQLCDLGALRKSGDAANLAGAIMGVLTYSNLAKERSASSSAQMEPSALGHVPDHNFAHGSIGAGIPNLTGVRISCRFEQIALSYRLGQIVDNAKLFRFIERVGTQRRPLWQILLIRSWHGLHFTAIFLFLTLDIYAKYYYFFNVR